MKEKFKSESISITKNNQVIGKQSSRTDIVNAVINTFVAAGISVVNPEDLIIEKRVTPVKCAGLLKYQCIINWYVDYSNLRQVF